MCDEVFCQIVCDRHHQSQCLAYPHSPPPLQGHTLLSRLRWVRFLSCKSVIWRMGTWVGFGFVRPGAGFSNAFFASPPAVERRFPTVNQNRRGGCME